MKKETGKKRFERVYTVAEVAEMFSVDRKTVYKWLECDVIPRRLYFKLPNGYFRIRESAIAYLQSGE